MKKIISNIKTLRDLVVSAKDNYSNSSAFSIRSGEGYKTVTYSEFANDVLSMASYFVTKGYSGKQVALVGENSYEWVVTHLGIVCSGGIAVPLDRELQPEEIAGLCDTSESVALIYSQSYSHHYEKCTDRYSKRDCYVIGEDSINGHRTYSDILEEGRTSSSDNYKSVFDVTLDSMSVCSICFTSGTTGVSKGVMLSHDNFISNCKSCNEIILFGGNRFSLLPMHHTYEFTCGLLYSIMTGCNNCINHSVKYVSQNLKLFAPTDMLIVPLVAESLHNNIWNNIKSSGKEKTVRRMIKVTRFLNSIGIDLRKKIFKKVHDGLGGKMQNIFVGGAHIDKDIVCSFIDFGFNLYIGYGITECSPLITGNISLRHDKADTCGQPISCNTIRISNPVDGEGEIEVKGKNVMLGYFKREDLTKEVLVDGWYKTGDIGKIDKDNFLRITGRIKNIIVLKNGKNIYPEEIEGYIYKIPYVKEVLVYSQDNDTGSELVLCAEVFIDADKVALDNVTNVEDIVKEEISKINSNLSYFKRIVNIKFRETEFDKTTSRKIKRNQTNGDKKTI